MVQDRDIVAVENWLEIVCSLSNGSNTNDLEWPWRLVLLYEAFLTTIHQEMSHIIYSVFSSAVSLSKYDFSYSYAAVDKISTSIVHHMVPVQ